MEARHCPPPGGWAVCGGGGGSGRGGWSECRAGSGKLPPPSRSLQVGVGPGRVSWLHGLSRPATLSRPRPAGTGAAPLPPPPLQPPAARGPHGCGTDAAAAWPSQVRGAGGGGHGGRKGSQRRQRWGCTGRAGPPWLPWPPRSHPHRPQPAPSARWPGRAAAGCSRAAGRVWSCRGGRVHAGTV